MLNSLGSNDIDSLVLPEGLENIGYRAFHFAHIKNVTLPNSLSNIGDMVFTTDITKTIVWRGTTYTQASTFNSAVRSAGISTGNAPWYDD